MSQKLFSAHDTKAEAYLPPVLFKSKGEALRAFEVTCKDPNSQFYKYPADFTFVEIGEFDETTGKINAHDFPIILANASQYQQ